jgi:hypothetical protein
VESVENPPEKSPVEKDIKTLFLDVGTGETLAAPPTQEGRGDQEAIPVEVPQFLTRLNAALFYASLGKSVLPLHYIKNGRCSCGKPPGPDHKEGKHPLGLLVPHGHLDATTDETQIRAWWGKYPEANIGIVCGKISNLGVLDIDYRNGGQESLARLEKEHGVLWKKTYHVKTGNGEHFYFDLPADLTQFKGKDGLPGYPGLDLKGDGGYVVAPPSNHISGNPYTALSSPQNHLILPPWLPALVVGPNGDGRTTRTTRKKHDYAALLQGVSDGQRNDTAKILTGHFLAKGHPEDEVLGIMLGWNQRNDPPLVEEKLRILVGNIAKKEEAALASVPEPSQGLVFPSHIITGAAGHFANTHSKYIEASLPALFMGDLTCLGHMISEKVTLAGSTTVQPRLYLAILGESADDRKSAGMKRNVNHYRDTIDDFDGFHLLRGVGSGEGLARFYQPIEKVDKDEPPKTRALLCLDEFKTLIQKMQQDSSVLLPVVTSLFEDNDYESLTKNRKIKIHNAHLSILAASTLDTYRTMFSPIFEDIGFLNRLFLVISNAEVKFSKPRDLPPEIENDLRRDLGEVLAFVESLSKGSVYQMPMTPEAEEIFDHWYKNRERGKFSKRLDTYGLRLMILLAINEKKDRIDQDIVEKAVDLLNYQLAARKFAHPISADSPIAKMEERIRLCLESKLVMTRTELKKECGVRAGGITIFVQAIKNLAQEGEIKEIRVNKKLTKYQWIPEG